MNSVFMNFVFEIHRRRPDGLIENSPLEKQSYVGMANFPSSELAEKFIDSMKNNIKKFIEENQNEYDSQK